MIHFDVFDLIKTQEQSDELRAHLDGKWNGLRLGAYNTPRENIISAVIYKDDQVDDAAWLLIKYPEARRIQYQSKKD